MLPVVFLHMLYDDDDAYVFHDVYVMTFAFLDAFHWCAIPFPICHLLIFSIWKIVLVRLKNSAWILAFPVLKMNIDFV